MPVGWAPASPETWMIESCGKFVWKCLAYIQAQMVLFKGKTSSFQKDRVLLHNNSSLPTGVRECPWDRESIILLYLGLILVAGMHMLQSAATHDELVCCRQQGLRKVSRVCVMFCVANTGPFPRETTSQGRNSAENGQYVFISVTWSKSKVSLLNTLQTYISIWLLLVHVSS